LNVVDRDDWINISNSSLSEMEVGHARLRFELIYNIIKVHNVNIIDLMVFKEFFGRLTLPHPIMVRNQVRSPGEEGPAACRFLRG
jgi:hypothetical protein